MAISILLPILLSIITLIINPRFRFHSHAFAFDNNYSPPSPPPPPPHPPTVTCEDDLSGTGTFDTVCQISSDLNLTSSVYIQGKGNFHILPNVKVDCSTVPGCKITMDITGDFVLGENSSIVSGMFELSASNVSLSVGSVINSTGLGGEVPSWTSGTPRGLDGAGGGYGGRGAHCLGGNNVEEVWGGDCYGWSSLVVPVSYGSKGGSMSKEVDYGGGGGGHVKIAVEECLVVNGSVLADGGNGGNRGGGGSGGSVYIRAHKMIGGGVISACGGDGFGGGGGGRVSIDVFSWHDEPKIFAHGGISYGCADNAGGAGTFYDAVPRSLIISNHNRSTHSKTIMKEFPNHPLWTNVYVQNRARASVPLRWSRVQVQGQIKLEADGELSFGLSHIASSEFELLAEELLMSESVMKVNGALRMSVKMYLMWSSALLVDGGGDVTATTSLLEASNLLVLRKSSSIRSNANLGVHGQGLLNLTGPGDIIEAQHLVLSLFYGIHVGPGSILRGPLENVDKDNIMPSLLCDLHDCPRELLHPPDDCSVNSSLSFTLQICRVEDILVQGNIEGSIVHFHRARTVDVQPSGVVTASGLGCTGGVGRGKVLSNGLGGGGGHGGVGGAGCYGGTCVEGGVSYGSEDLPCELGSGSGDGTLAGSTAGGGIVVMGSMEHPLASLSVYGSVRADGGSYHHSTNSHNTTTLIGGVGGGSGGTVLLFLKTLTVGDNATLSSVGGNGGPLGGGGGAGGRMHFHWSAIPTGDFYQPIASVTGSIVSSGGLGGNEGVAGEYGIVTGKACPKGLFGTFCKECPPGTYKDVVGSDKSLCRHCPSMELPHRAVYIAVRGGVTESPCPYECLSDRYHMPHCYTALEELIYTFGGPWLFGLLLVGILILLAIVLRVARMRFVGVDDLPSPASSKHASQIDHSFPFLESLNEVLETNRTEESQTHVFRMYFMGPNSFAEPWYLPHSLPAQLRDIVYEGAFDRFVDEVNLITSYQWWEESIYNILCVLAYPMAWSWKQWRRGMKLQRLREFVRSEYDHACLRSCRSRALYEGIKVAATPDLLLAYVDFFLGGDEKRRDLPPRLHQRFPLYVLFGGDGNYTTPFTLHSDNILTSLMSQSVPPTTWYRLVAGLNALLRLVRRGYLRKTFQPVLGWLESLANPVLKNYGLRIDLACFQATSCGYCQYGLLVSAILDERIEPSLAECTDGRFGADQSSSFGGGNSSGYNLEEARLDHVNRRSGYLMRQKRSYGVILTTDNIHSLEERRNFGLPFSLILHNTKPVGHQDLVGLVISILLLGDFTLVLLTILQLYSASVADVFFVLLILPLGNLLPFPAGINALFSHGPRRSASLARLYALWNVTSMVNVVVAFICGFINNSQESQNKMLPNLQPWGMIESEWWIFPTGLFLCKCLQSRLINWHVANLEIQDRSLYSNDFDVFWRT